jgi:hypothetical protein
LCPKSVRCNRRPDRDIASANSERSLLRAGAAPHACRTTGTWPAMKNERRLSERITPRLPINLMAIADIRHAAIVCLNVRV